MQALGRSSHCGVADGAKKLSRGEVLSSLGDSPSADLHKHLPQYLQENRRHDDELLAAAWPVVMQNGSLLKDFLFHYARIDAAACLALLRQIRETLAGVPVIQDNLRWFEWFGNALCSGLGHAGHLYDFVQIPFGEQFDAMFTLVQELLALEPPGDAGAIHSTVAPWLKLLAGYDHANELQRANLAEKILSLARNSRCKEDYPISYLVRFPGNKAGTLLACITHCMSETNEEDVKLSLAGGSHMANIRNMVYLHALLVALLHQKVEPAKLGEDVRLLQWSDREIFLLAVCLMQDIGFHLAGVRIDTDPPEWFAARPLTRYLLLAVYDRDSAAEGQALLRRALERMNFIERKQRAPKITKIPADLPGALELIARLPLKPGEIKYGKPATPAAISRAKLKVRIPKDLLALYKHFDGIAGEIVPVSQLAGLQKDFQKEIRLLLKEGPEDENFSADEIDIRTLMPVENFTVVSETSGGDFLFLHAKAKTVNGNSPVLRYCHDQSFVCKIEAESLPFFAARLFLRRWAELNGREKQFFRVLYPDSRLAATKKKE